MHYTNIKHYEALITLKNKQDDKPDTASGSDDAILGILIAVVASIIKLIKHLFCRYLALVTHKKINENKSQIGWFERLTRHYSSSTAQANGTHKERQKGHPRTSRPCSVASHGRDNTASPCESRNIAPIKCAK